LIDIGRPAGADPDRADLNVAIEDLPAFDVGVFRAAAVGKPLQVVGWMIEKPQARVRARMATLKRQPIVLTRG